VSRGKKGVEGQRFWIDEEFADKPEQIPDDLVAGVMEKINKFDLGLRADFPRREFFYNLVP